ncbi:MAG: peptidase family protein [Phycisphaerales bacterium]|nr:peptidase family protein [Phycisphaerales bacterium]
MIPFTQALNGVASEWSSAMVRASWQGGIALAIVWALCLALPKLPARARCWLWRAAYLKLLVALVWTTPVDLPLLPAKAVIAAAATPRADLIPPPMTSAHVDAGIASTPAIAPVALHISGTAILLCVWTAGVLVALAQIAREWRAAVQLRRGARPLDDPSLAELLAFGVHPGRFREVPPVLISDDATGPLLLGGWRPAVVLPAQLLRECTTAQARLAVAHEMAHYRRCDLLWCWLPRLGRVLFFFHPLVLATQREWRAAQESACDQLAVELTGARAAEYAAALLSVVSASSFSGRRVLALGVADSSSNLRRRLLTMKHFNSLSHRRWTSVGVVLTFAMVVALIPWRVTAQQPQREADRKSAPSDASNAPPTRPLATATAGDGKQDELVLTGFVDAVRPVVASRVDGFIKEIRCKEGDRVKSGELLIALDDTDDKIRLDQSKASLNAAMAELNRAVVENERMQALRAHKVVAGNEVDQAAAQLAVAKAQVQRAELDVQQNERRLQQTQIAAPSGGTVAKCEVTVGQAVQRGQAVAVIVNTSELSVRAQLPVQDLARVKVGQKIKASLRMNPPRDFSGQITFISPTVDENLGTVEMKASVTNQDEKLRPGMAVIVHVETAE